MIKSTLNDKLNKLAEGLEPSEKKVEAELRLQWNTNIRAMKECRYNLGKALAGYEKLYKAKRKWLTFLSAIGMQRKTADDFIARYTVASEIPQELREAAKREGVDLCKPAVLNLVDVSAWKQKKNLTDEEVKKEVARLKQQSKRKAPAAATSKTPTEREAQLLAFIEKLYQPVDPSVRLKELPAVLKRLEQRLLTHFSIPEAA